MSLLSSLLIGNNSGPTGDPSIDQLDENGQYIQPDAIKQQYNLANMLRSNQPATSWAGIIANGLGAVAGNLVQGNADQALQRNQTLRTQSINGAANAKDLPSLSKALISSPVPEIQNAGLETRIKQLSDDPNKIYNVRAAQYRLLGGDPNSPEGRAYVLAGQLPAPKDPLDQEYKRAQIKALHQKGGDIKEVNGRLVRVMPDGTATEIYNAGPDTSKVPQGYRLSPDGQNLVPIPGGPGDKLSDVESKDALFAERMLRADKAIDEIVPMDKNGNLTGYDPTGVKQQLWPDESRFNSADWKNLSQAKREFIAGILRKDTGAAVTEKEFSDYDKIYFPQPGDSAQAMLQKKAARAAAAAGLRGASGRAFNRMFPNYDETGGPGAVAISTTPGRTVPASSNPLNRAIEKSDALARARKAIAEGAPRDAVIQRLQQNGIDPSGL